MSEKRDVSISESRVKPVGYVSSQFDVTLPTGHTLEDINQPEYWAHTAMKFNQGDILFVRTDDELHIGMFYITDCSRNHANLHKMLWQKIGKSEAVTHDDLKYQWKGPHKKHCVIRVTDGMIVQEAMATKDAAMEWIVKQKQAA